MNLFRLSAFFIPFFLMIPTAFAQKFSNQFTEFELPPNWVCALEGAEWICQSREENKKREAIIVLAAKLRGTQDSLDQYYKHLEQPKKYTSVTGKPMTSEPKFVKNTMIQNQPWVDSLHMESEIPSYYTRYIATIKEDIGVLITYSVEKSKYQEYQKIFDNMVNTLKVFRKAGGINVAPQTTSLFNAGGTSGVFSGIANPLGGADDAPKQKKAGMLGGLLDDETTIYLAAGAVVVLFLIARKRKKKK